MGNKLKDICHLHFGFYDKPKSKGDAIYLQARNFNELGLLGHVGDALVTINDKSKSHLLNDGDILFVGKGFRNFAWKYSSKIGNAIASSIFFVIKPNQNKVDSDYLVTIFNSVKYQSYFQSLGSGSSIPSIRKNELESIEVPLPALDVQRKIAALSELHIKNLAVTEKIIENKNKLFQAVIHDILKR